MNKSIKDQEICLENKSILITGGTGSFGKSLIEEITKNHNPKRLVIFSRDEQKQYAIAQKYKNKDFPYLRFFLGDIRDRDRLDMALSGIDIVIHAAAMKIVTSAEYNPFECIRTNVIGAENLVTSCINKNVKKVIALSTDKAVNPINLYGASKLAADKIFVAANNLSQRKTNFAVVRYGNVIGSRGSIIPNFLKIAKDKNLNIPLTDPQMTRFWISIEDGVKFVLNSLNTMIGGEIFIPKIPSMKLIDVAKTLAPRNKIDIIGIRPGEKLHEIMISKDDARNTFELTDRYVVLPSISFGETYQEYKYKTKVSENFEYKSETNKTWLTQSALKKIIKETSLTNIS